MHSSYLIDLFFIFIVISSSIAGYARGLIASLMSFTGWISSIVLTYYTFPKIEPILRKEFTSEIGIFILGYPAILLCFLLLFGSANIFINRAFKSITFNNAEKLLGLVFGIVRGIIIDAILFIFICIAFSFYSDLGYHKAKSELSISFEKSITMPWIINGHDIVLALIPSDIMEKFIKSEEEAK